MLRRFEALLNPTAGTPASPPHAGLAAFYRFYIRQVRGLTIALFICGGSIAVLDTMIPAFIGRVMTLVSSQSPETFFHDNGRTLLGMAAVLLFLRPLSFIAHNILVNQIVNPGFSNMIRWQNHWHVVRQSWTFFQNDFAGRIANRVQQTGPALRESLVMAFDAAWYILVYGSSALILLARLDSVLMLPMVIWFIFYAAMLRFFVPRLRARSRRMSEMRSMLTGRIVDSYTNILTVKLFARAADEDQFVRDAIDEHTAAFRDQTRMTTAYTSTLVSMNACLVVSMAALSLWKWSQGHIAIGAVATAIPLAWQLNNIAGWVARSVTSIFENIGTVQDGMRSIDVPREMPDQPGAGELQITGGEIRFEDLHFDYGRVREGAVVLHGINLTIAPGERVGLIGPSGAGKSTLVNLLLHFYEPASGRILIDGQDIAGVTQESLRRHIAMVTQDTSLLHRSIAENIRYGQPQATDAQIVAAAKQAHAHDFIVGLQDWFGRTGYDAHVGERGVKLSGGQRQRVALARVILKNAPILVLDEATSALDSEVEAAIQEQLDTLMEGRTVIAIAHRLSTIARMDRLIVLDEGRIVESGSHQQLLRQNGVYARLWRRQSGAFDTVSLDDAVGARSAD
jgi:ATP-binding cassette subfamily B multidrug efflux pump